MEPPFVVHAWHYQGTIRTGEEWVRVLCHTHQSYSGYRGVDVIGLYDRLTLLSGDYWGLLCEALPAGAPTLWKSVPESWRHSVRVALAQLDARRRK